ncbi:PaaI family thioesterase [Thermodesulfobacteriota bacterium]
MISDNNKCFVCGRDNPEGLQLEFNYSADGKKARTTFAPPQKFQGWQDVVHGGIIVTLLDEVMAKVAAKSAGRILTGEIATKFKNPARIKEPLTFEGEIESVTRRVIYTRGSAAKQDGTVIAQATAKFFIAA